VLVCVSNCAGAEGSGVKIWTFNKAVITKNSNIFRSVYVAAALGAAPARDADPLNNVYVL